MSDDVYDRQQSALRRVREIAVDEFLKLQSTVTTAVHQAIKMGMKPDQLVQLVSGLWPKLLEERQGLIAMAAAADAAEATGGKAP